MKVFESYFAPIKTEASKHSVEPTGLLDVNRLINAESAYWISADQAVDLRPKHIVLTDWTLADKGVDYIRRLYETLLVLLNSPYSFVISWYQDGKIEPLTKDTLYNIFYLDKRKAIKPVSDECIKKLMAEKGLSQKEVLSLTSHEVSCLLNEERTSETLYISDIYHSSFSLEEILKSLDKKKRYIIHFGDYDSQIRAWFNQKKGILKRYGELVLDIDDVVINPTSESLDAWIEDEHVLNKRQIAKTKRLTLENLFLDESEKLFYTIMRFDVYDLLNHYVALEDLSLSYISFFGYPSFGKEIKSSKLKRIQIKGSVMSLEDLFGLVQSSHSLESLTLSKTELLGIDGSQVQEDMVDGIDINVGWDTLKTLTLDDVCINDKRFLDCLMMREKAFSQLQAFNYKYVGRQDKQSREDEVHCLDLAELIIERGSQQLTSIVLDGVLDATFSLFQPKFQLPNLRVLKLNHCECEIDDSLSLSELITLLSHTHNLTTLSLTSMRLCDYSLEYVWLEGVDWTHLEELDLSGSTVPYRFLKILTAKASNLKKLNLSNAIIGVSDEEERPTIEIPSVEELNLSGHALQYSQENASSNAPTLLHFDKARKLKQLDLSGLSLSIEYSVDIFTCTELEDLCLRNTEFDFLYLNNALARKRNLHTLDLSNAKIKFNKLRIIKTLPLRSLKKLELSNLKTNLSETDGMMFAINLINSSDGLTSLSLDGLQLDSSLLKIESSKIEMLKSISLDEAVISIASLRYLLQHVPNIEKLDLSTIDLSREPYYRKMLSSKSSYKAKSYEELILEDAKLTKLRKINLPSSFKRIEIISLLNAVKCLSAFTFFERKGPRSKANATHAPGLHSINYDREMLSFSGNDITVARLLAKKIKQVKTVCFEGVSYQIDSLREWMSDTGVEVFILKGKNAREGRVCEWDEGIYPNKIRTFSIEGTEISEMTFSHLFSDMVNLRKLQINKTTIRFETLQKRPRLNHLESLSIIDSQIDYSTLLWLLGGREKNINHVHIDTEKYKFICDENKKLHLEGFLYDFPFIVQYLDSHPEIEALDISNCNVNIDGELARTRLRESKIKTLRLSNTRINVEFLNQLFMVSTKMRQITIDNLIVPDIDSLKLTGLVNREIEALTISISSEDEAKTINPLLTFSPKLKRLNLKSIRSALYYVSTIALKGLSYLETIELSRMRISPEDFSCMLRASHASLVDLVLSDSVFNESGSPTEGIDLGAVTFPNIERIEISNELIPVRELYFMVINAPKLKMLFIPRTMIQSLYKMGLFEQNKALISCLGFDDQRWLLERQQDEAHKQAIISTEHSKKKEEHIGLKGLSSVMSHLGKFMSSTVREEPEPAGPVKFNVEKSSSQMGIDFNTVFPHGKRFNVKRKVYALEKGEKHPRISLYRSCIYDTLNFNHKYKKTPFELTSSKTLDLCDVNPVSSDDDLRKIGESLINEQEIYYYVSDEMMVGPKWSPLTTLSPTDLLTHVNVKPNNVEIKYSETYRQYFIRSISSYTHPISIDYLLKQARHPEPQVLPERVRDLVQELKAFHPGDLDNVTNKTKPEEILLQMYKQKKGSCRHRVMIFKHMMKTQHPTIPVHVITNDIHAFVEVFYKGTWVQCDLGGYPVSRTVHENVRFIEKPSVVHDRMDISEISPEKKSDPKKGHLIKIPVDPTHRPQAFYQTQRVKSRTAFCFKGKNKTLNQGMIIEKLSQFILLTDKSKTLLQTSQDGICDHLSRLFIQKSLNDWDRWVQLISDWDGQESHLDTKTMEALNELYAFIQKPVVGSRTFAGKGLKLFLSENKINLTLSNPWHEIALKYNTKLRKWICYDPNYVNGYKVINEDDIDKEIYTALGELVYVEGKHDIDFKIAMGNVHEFIERGGFHVFYEALVNRTITSHSIDLTRTFTYENLYGLYFRDTDDKPIWFTGLAHELSRDFFLYYLRLLKQSNPECFIADINRSVSGLDESEQAKALNLLSQYILTDIPLQDEMDETAYQAFIKTKEQADTQQYQLLKETYPHYFNAVSTEEHFLNSEQLIDGLLHEDLKKRLVELPTQKICNQLIRLLQQEAIKQGQPYFIVNRPEDMVCAAPWLEKVGQHGVIRKGPGGPLYDFIKANEDSEKNPLIMINYGHFKPEDIVRLNTIIDDVRKADGVLLPENYKVVGVNNLGSPDLYQAADFHSRFNGRMTPHIDKDEMTQLHPESLLHESDEEQDDAYHIDLFHGSDWKEILVGYWSIEGKSLLFNEGVLSKALASQKPIVIHNPPKDTEAFETFWFDLQLKEAFEGYRLPTPITVSDGYDFNALIKPHRFVSKDSQAFYELPHQPILNQNALSSFTKRYVCDNALKVLHPDHGLLAAHKKRYDAFEPCPPFICQVTGAMGNAQWAKLLTEAHSLGVPIAFELLPGAILPDSLSDVVKIEESHEAGPSPAQEADIIVTNDIDAACLIYQATHEKRYHVIDVTEYKPHDVLIHLKADFDQENLDFSFHEEKKAIVTLLEKGESIILKGPLKSGLREALLPYLREYAAQLTVITDNENAWGSIPHKTHQVTSTEKLTLLEHINPTLLIDPALAERHSLIELDALQRYEARCKKERLSFESPWDPLYRLSPAFQLGKINEETVEDDILTFNDTRLKHINDAFEVSPILCLSGVTGVGKTTFIQNTLAKETAVFMGEDKMSEWAESAGGVLFIDEANINQREWSEFEGLFNEPPSIVINGQWYPLTDKHKVIFAFNPASYGAERKINKLFKRHPNTAVFNPLPLNIIYGLSLKPLFKGTTLEKENFAISNLLLNMYERELLSSKDKVTISIRDLKSITLLIIAYHRLYPLLDIKALSYYMIKEVVGIELLNESEQAYIKAFDLPSSAVSGARTDDADTVFIENQSTKSISNSLSLFLDLRQFRRASLEQLDEEQLHGGLGGFILEGESGLGKSHLVLNTLHGYGLLEGDNDTDTPQENVFYHIPVSMPLDQKKALILKAFHEGNPVIMDEINSCVMMERLLNALLMGKTLDGQWARKPGFFIIGTQNPIYLKGRNAISEAQSKRVIKKIYPLYTTDEMMTILLRKGMGLLEAKAMVDVFMAKREAAISADDESIPSFREMTNLINVISEDASGVAKKINAFVHTLSGEMEFAISLLSSKQQYELFQLSLTCPTITQYMLKAAWVSEKAAYNMDRLDKLIKVNTMKGVEVIAHLLFLPKTLHHFYLEYARTTPKILLDKLRDIERDDDQFYQALIRYTPTNQYQPTRTNLLNELLERYHAGDSLLMLSERFKQVQRVRPTQTPEIVLEAHLAADRLEVPGMRTEIITEV